MSNAILLCNCGCNQSGHRNQMTFVRSLWQHGPHARPGLVTWQVLKTCQAAFESELVHMKAIEGLAREAAERGWGWKFWHAAQFYDLQKAIYTRRKGAAAAARIARHCVASLLLPRWIVLRLKTPREADISTNQPTP